MEPLATPPPNDSQYIDTVAESIAHRKDIAIPVPGGNFEAPQPFLTSAIRVPGAALRWGRRGTSSLLAYAAPVVVKAAATCASWRMHKLLCSVLIALSLLVGGSAFAKGRPPKVAEPAGREVKEREARKACLEGDYVKGVSILSDLFLDSKDASYIYRNSYLGKQRRFHVRLGQQLPKELRGRCGLFWSKLGCPQTISSCDGEGCCVGARARACDNSFVCASDCLACKTNCTAKSDCARGLSCPISPTHPNVRRIENLHRSLGR
jgi:hypothetical protein